MATVTMSASKNHGVEMSSQSINAGNSLKNLGKSLNNTFQNVANEFDNMMNPQPYMQLATA